jgi:hypothetical protein
MGHTFSRLCCGAGSNPNYGWIFPGYVATEVTRSLSHCCFKLLPCRSEYRFAIGTDIDLMERCHCADGWRSCCRGGGHKQARGRVLCAARPWPIPAGQAPREPSQIHARPGGASNLPQLLARKKLNVVSFSRAYWSSLQKRTCVSLWYQQASQNLGCRRGSLFGGPIFATPIPCAGPHPVILSEQLTLSVFSSLPSASP